MISVFIRQYGFRQVQSPIYTKGSVHNGNAPVSFRTIKIVTFILEDRDVAENGKTVGESAGYEELAVIMFSKKAAYVPAVCRRAFADVDRYIEYRATDASDQFRLGVRRSLEVKSAHHAAGGTRFIVLNEVSPADRFLKYFFVETLEKIAARIGKDPGLENHNAFDFCLDYFHVSRDSYIRYGPPPPPLSEDTDRIDF